MKLSNIISRTMLFTAGAVFASALPAQEELMTMEEVEELPPLYTSEIEVGAGYASEDSLKFGEYNGLEDEGGFFIGNIQVRKYIAPDGPKDTYWELDGRNLGLDSRSLYMEYSRTNLFRVNFEYDQIPHNRFNDGLTPFIGTGTRNQTLPAGWVGAGSTAGLTALVPSLRGTGDIETERQRYGGGFDWRLTDRWSLSGNYRHEEKDGTDTIGAIFGTNGGNPRGSVIVRPIDYESEEFDFAVNYNGDRGQYSLSYHLSVFDNNEPYLFWDNPFNLGGWDAGANFSDDARGRMGSEPDNHAWKINFAGGYNLGMRTRLSGSVSYGQMKQDESFLPFSSVFPAPIPLPRDSLNGEIETLYANINVSTRVTSRLSLKGRYTYDERDNNTPRDIYVRIAGDAGAQGALISGNARVNWPYSLERHKLDLEGSYNLYDFLPGTRISAGYEFESKDRDFTEFDSTDEHTGKVRLSFTPSAVAGGWVRYQHQERSGDSTYVSNQPFRTGHNPDYIAFLEANDPGGLFENDPLLRKFHLADRDRDQVAAALNFYPSDVVALTLSGRYNKDDFDNSQVGLLDSENSSVSFDAAFTPNKKISLHGFVTYENYKYRQRAFEHPGFLGDLTPTTDRFAVFGDNFWGMESEEDVVTGGAGIDWNVIEDKFNIKADILVSLANTETTPFDVGTGLQPTLALPDLKSDLYRFTLEGEYKYRENMGVRVRYLYEEFDTSDFALDLVSVNTLSNVILLGNGTPNYSDHVIGVSWFYNWQ